MSSFASTVVTSLHRLAGPTGKGIVAVSGGADSVALLRALAQDGQAAVACIAHLNHQLRGADSDGDADFVSHLCPQLPHCVETADVRQIATNDNANLEATARHLRYEFLARVARECGACWIATAHTLDDQAETVLHRLLRGTGLRGLRGIAESREAAPDILLVRPMLSVSRAQVISFLQSIGQAWREDASNQDRAFTRNRIRHELMPILRTFNPAIADVLGRTAQQANAIYCDLEQESASLLIAVELPRAEAVVVLDRNRLQNVPPHLVRELLIAIWLREAWPRDGMTQAHWDRVVEVIMGTAKTYDLPGGLRVSARANVVLIGPLRVFS